MADRQFKPGRRVGTRAGLGKIGDNRIAWLRTLVGQMVLSRYEEDEHREDFAGHPEAGSSYVLYIPVAGRKPAAINLTALTQEELDMMREFFTLAFDLAEPVVVQRDKVAEDAAAEGDDSFVRIYRQVPQFIKRPRAFGTHDEGVLRGSEGVPPGLSGAGDLDGGVRGTGDELAPAESSHPGTEDDASETD